MKALLWLAGGMIALLALYSLWPQASAAAAKPDPVGASIACKNVATDRLRAPSTARFAGYTEQTVTDLGGGRFQVLSWVDAQNGFGAQVRTRYTCRVQSADGKDWRIEAFEMA
jgi:hypothetical protein